MQTTQACVSESTHSLYLQHRLRTSHWRGPSRPGSCPRQRGDKCSSFLPESLVMGRRAVMAEGQVGLFMSPPLRLLTHLPHPKLHPESQTRKQKPQDRWMWPVRESPPHPLSQPSSSSLGWGGVGELPSPPRDAGGQGSNLRRVGIGQVPKHPQTRASMSTRAMRELSQDPRKTSLPR